MIGRTLGHYEVVELLGSGGMGEVYRARDPRLKRDVAIKVLAEAFAVGPERLARLEREAHLLAALNHPNVAAIFGIEEDRSSVEDGVSVAAASVRFLVLELVEGETLADRLALGPARSRGGAADRPPDRRGAGGRARQGHPASGSQARQRRGHCRGAGEAARFRFGEAYSARGR
jgi:serine/threonine protein kinase